MNTKKNLLGLAVLTTSLALVGCGGSSSSGNQQTDEDTTPDEPTFPAAFAFSQDPTAALDEMKELPEKAFAEELYDFIKTQLIDGDQEVSSNSSNRFDFWVTTGAGDATGLLQCGTSDFGTLKPSSGFTAPSSENTILLFDVGNIAAVELTSLGLNADNNPTSLWRSTVTIAFDDCQLPDADNPSTIIATLNGQVALERTWVGESNSRETGVTLENFSFNFTTFEGSSLTVDHSSGAEYNLAGKFVDTHVFGEITTAQQNTLRDPSFNAGTANLVLSRLASNDFKGMYAFDAGDLQITTTLTGESPEIVQFNNFASVFVAPTALNNDPQNDVYTVYVETPYRGDETAESSSIVFSTGEEAESIFIETLSNGGNDKFITANFEDVGDEASFLRDRSDNATLDCPTNASIGYSSTPSTPLVAGVSFLLDGSSQQTTRVYVDENNVQTDRDPAVAISTASEDTVCRDGENGPTRFIPLPGLGPISYVSLPPAV